MKKIDATIKKETVYITVVTVILSLLMQSIFLIVGKWDITVLLGNLLGICAAAGNFLLLGLTVQSAIQRESDEVKKLMKLSQSLRLLLLFVVALIAYLVPIFHLLSVVLTYLFPRVAIALHPILEKD